MQNRDVLRLRHMLDAAKEAIEFARPLQRRDLDHDRKSFRAIVGALLVIGEAAGQVSGETRARSPQIPWKSVVGMRNVLIHAYHEIDNDVVWAALHTDLPPLVAALEAALREMT